MIPIKATSAQLRAKATAAKSKPCRTPVKEQQEEKEQATPETRPGKRQLAQPVTTPPPQPAKAARAETPPVPKVKQDPPPRPSRLKKSESSGEDEMARLLKEIGKPCPER